MSEFVSFGGQPTAPPPMAAAPPPPTPPVSSPLGATTDSFEEDLFGTAGSGSGSVYSAPPTFASPTPMTSVRATATASGPSDSVVGGGCTLAAAKKQWLTDYIRQQDPDKVHTVDKVLVAYLGREEVMIRKLSDKYGVLPPPLPTATSIATAAAGAPSSQVDLLGGLSVPPPKAKATQRASQIDQQFLATLSPEFILEQEQLLQRIKDGSKNERGRQRATTPPRGRTNERHQHRSRYGAGGKMLRRSSSLPIRKGLMC